MTEQSALVHEIRRLQYAANMLNFHEFCEALGLSTDDSYAKGKFSDFQLLGTAHRFDGSVLDRLVALAEEKSERALA